MTRSSWIPEPQAVMFLASAHTQKTWYADYLQADASRSVTAREAQASAFQELWAQLYAYRYQTPTSNVLWKSEALSQRYYRSRYSVDVSRGRIKSICNGYAQEFMKRVGQQPLSRFQLYSRTMISPFDNRFTVGGQRKLSGRYLHWIRSVRVIVSIIDWSR